MNKIKTLSLILLMAILVSFVGVSVAQISMFKQEPSAKAFSPSDFNVDHLKTYDNIELKNCIVASYVNLTLEFGVIVRGYKIDILINDEDKLINNDNLKIQLKEFLENNFSNVAVNSNSVFAYNSYDSITDFYIALGYSGYDKNTPSELDVKNNLLTQEYTSKIDINSFFAKGTIGGEIKTIIGNYYNASFIKESYIFGNKMSLKRINSNAQSKYVSNFYRINIHQFIYSPTQADYHIVQLVPNSVNLNIFAIALGSIFILCSVIFLLKWSKKNDNLE